MSSWPLSQDFNEAVQNPASAFADPPLKTGRIATGPLGVPRPRSGNYADVYEVRAADGTRWAIKCFTRPTDAGMADRYAAIDKHLKQAALPFTVGFSFLPDGVRVKGKWYPAVKMQWVDGFPLNQFVRDNLGRASILESLLQLWVRLCRRLRETGMAHGDLQHGNVLLVPADGGKASLGLKLVDYDGMFVPALAGQPTGELGHASYQHPARAVGGVYSPDLDRFPHLVVATALRAVLVGGRALWDRYDTGDNLLFTEKDFQRPAESPLMRELWDAGDPFTVGLLAHLVNGCDQPMSRVPWLDQLTDGKQPPTLTPSQERQAAAALGVAAEVGSPSPLRGGAGEGSSGPPVERPNPSPQPPPRSGEGEPIPGRPKRNTGLLVALGAGGATFAAIAVGAMLLFGGKKPDPNPKPTEPDQPAVAVVPPPDPAPVEPVVPKPADPVKPAPPPAVPQLAVAHGLPLALFDGTPVGELALDAGGGTVYAVAGGKVKAVAATGRPLFQYAPPAGTPVRVWATPARLIVEVRLPGGKAELRFLDPVAGRPVPPEALDIAPDMPPLHVAVAPDGSQAAVVKANGHVALFDLTPGRGSYFTLHPDPPAVTAHLPLPARRILLNCTNQAQVYPLTDLPRFQPFPFAAVKPRLDVLDVAAGLDRLAYRQDGGFVVKRLGENWPTPAVAVAARPEAKLRFLADGRRAAVADSTGLTLLDTDANQPLGHLPAPSAAPVLAVTPDGAVVAVAHQTGVSVVRTGLPSAAPQSPTAVPQLALADVGTFSKEDLGERPRFAVTDRTGQTLYTIIGTEVKSFAVGTRAAGFTYTPGGNPQHLFPTPDGRVVVRVNAPGNQIELHQLNARTGTRLPGGVLNVTPMKPGRRDVAVSTDGSLAAVAAGGEVTVFDLKTGTPAGKKPCPMEVRGAFFTHPPTTLVLRTDTGAAAASPTGPDAFAGFGPAAEMVRLEDVATDAAPTLFTSRPTETTTRLSLIPLGGAGERVGLTAVSVADPRLIGGGRAVAFLADNSLELLDAATGKAVARRTGFGVPAQLRVVPGGNVLTVVWADSVAVYRVATGEPEEVAPAAVTAAKPPPPDADAVARAAEKVREAFKADYTRKAPADRRKLADKLLTEADATADSAIRFALLKDAAAAATDGADPALAMRAFDGLDDTFETDTTADRQTALEAVAKASTQAAVLRAAAEAAMELADALADRDEYDRAAAAAKLGIEWLTRTGATVPARDATARMDALLAQQQAFAPVKAAAERLKTDPTDAAAALVVGRFRCFVQRRWDDGLPLLAGGADDTLKTVAALDLKAKQDGEGTDMERGEAWEKYARTAPPDDRPAAEGRARFWFARALATARAGLDRSLVENKLAFTIGPTEFRPGVLCEVLAPVQNPRKKLGRIDPLIDALGRDFQMIDRQAVRVKWTGRLVAPIPGRYKLIADTNGPVTVKLGVPGDERPLIDTTRGGKSAEAFYTFRDKPVSLVVQWDARTDARQQQPPPAVVLKWLPPGGKNLEPIPPAAYYWPSTDKAKVTEK